MPALRDKVIQIWRCQFYQLLNEYLGSIYRFNLPIQSTTLIDFQNQGYRFTISKSWRTCEGKVDRNNMIWTSNHFLCQVNEINFDQGIPKKCGKLVTFTCTFQKKLCKKSEKFRICHVVLHKHWLTCLCDFTAGSPSGLASSSVVMCHM